MDNIKIYFWIKCFILLIPYPSKICSVVRCNVVSFTKLVPCKNYSLVNSEYVYSKAESVPQRTNNLHNSQSSQFWLEAILHSWFLLAEKVRGFGFWDCLSDLAVFPLHSPFFLQFLNCLDLDPWTLLLLLSLVSNWEHWERSVSSEHRIGWDGTSLWPTQLTHPVCVLTQLLSYPQATCWGEEGSRVGNRESLGASSNIKCPFFSLAFCVYFVVHKQPQPCCVICTVLATNSKHSTKGAVVKKVNSVPARSSMDRKLSPS